MTTDVEVLIIGGGVFGTSTAFHLAKKGCRGVRLLEARTIGSQSSSQAAGFIRVHRASDLAPEGKAGGLILDLCARLKADAYLSGVHGRDYLDAATFERAGIRLDFQQFTHPEYSQAPFHDGGFVPNLAAVDFLFSVGPRAGDILRAC